MTIKKTQMLQEILEDFEKKFELMSWKYSDYVGEQCDQDVVDELNNIQDEAWVAFKILKEEIENV